MPEPTAPAVDKGLVPRLFAYLLCLSLPALFVFGVPFLELGGYTDDASDVGYDVIIEDITSSTSTDITSSTPDLAPETRTAEVPPVTPSPPPAHAATKAVFHLDPARTSFLARYNITLSEIHPAGARCSGFDLRQPSPPEAVLQALQEEMANRGFIVFEDQGVLSGDEQVHASKFWGAREMHSTHGVHRKAPNRHIFRLSNSMEHGILGVGPQWHNDGSFEEDVFSHVGYHIVAVPPGGGGTQFAHQGAAFDALPAKKQELWSRLVSVNSNSGVLHPVVHDHPITGRKSVWLHLGMTGAVLEVDPEVKLGVRKADTSSMRLLTHLEMRHLFNEYNDLLTAGMGTWPGAYTINYEYQEGDCIFIDNLAVAHRASAEAHGDPSKHGLRILHRSTIKAPEPFHPPFGLPAELDIHGPNPFGKGNGIWQGGYIGFEWDPTIKMQNRRS